MGTATDGKQVARYAAAYQAALEHTRPGRGQKKRARVKAGRVLGVGHQRVADVLVVARKLGLLGTPLVAKVAEPPKVAMDTGVPAYDQWTRLPVTFEQLRDALTGSAYVRGTP